MRPAIIQEASVIVPTPLGAVSVNVTGGAGLVLDVEPVTPPRLAQGMAVDGVMLVRVRVDGGVVRDLPLNLHVTADHEGGPESGQWLDSVSYSTPAGTLQVAVRDGEWLEAKKIVSEPVAYEPRGFRQTVNAAPAGALLYVSVAWRARQSDRALPDDASTWFAADLALPS